MAKPAACQIHSSKESRQPLKVKSQGGMISRARDWRILDGRTSIVSE